MLLLVRYAAAATPVDGLDKDDPKVDGKSESCYTFTNHFVNWYLQNNEMSEGVAQLRLTIYLRIIVFQSVNRSSSQSQQYSTQKQHHMLQPVAEKPLSFPSAQTDLVWE